MVVVVHTCWCRQRLRMAAAAGRINSRKEQDEEEEEEEGELVERILIIIPSSSLCGNKISPKTYSTLLNLLTPLCLWLPSSLSVPYTTAVALPVLCL